MTIVDYSELIEAEKTKIIKLKSIRIALMLIMVVAIIVIMGYSFTIGTSSLTPVDAYKVLINQVFPGTFTGIPDNYVFIVTELRTPRVLVGALVGMILAMGGCILQAILKNPLATPYTLGVSSGAGMGASIYFVFGISLVSGTAGLILNSFICSIIPAAVMLFALTKKTVSPVTMILSGVAISYIFSSINMILQYFGDDTSMANVAMWSVGDLTSTSLWMVPIVIVAVILYFAYGMIVGKDIDILRMGDDSAISLGVDVKAIRGVSILVVCIMTAVAVSFTGPIGFVCLLAPHISRKFVGSELRWLLPFSALLGSILLLISDLISKTVIAPIMLPVGAITALIGAPVMVYMLYSKKGLTA